MTTEPAEQKHDIWKEWVLKRRFSGDQKLMETAMSESLIPWRNKILDNARLQDGEALLDVGCGDGLVAFGALERMTAGRVILSDISAELLEHVTELVEQMNEADRCSFVQASADNLAEIPTESVDVVTTRSVLIFVADKQQAFREFYRVLKPGGRISIFEPINSFRYPPPPDKFLGFDVSPVQDLAVRVQGVYRELQPPESDPMLNFDERNLIDMAENAGFDAVHLELQVELMPYPDKLDWEHFINHAGNPKIPTVGEAIEQVLTESEKARFIAHLRPLVEQGRGRLKSAIAYLWAVKS